MYLEREREMYMYSIRVDYSIIGMSIVLLYHIQVLLWEIVIMCENVLLLLLYVRNMLCYHIQVSL